MNGERPRIHWVSPLPPAATDIAHYTARILPALAERAEVVLWTDAEAWDGALSDHAAVRRYDPHAHAPLGADGLAPGAAAGEAVFFQIGNNWQFHAGALAVARRVPGVMVLHDTGLQDLAWMMIDNGLMSPEAYLADMAFWYGAEGRVAARQVLRREVLPAEIAPRFPLFETTLARAAAAVTHSRPAFEEIAARRSVPAYRLDLPFEPGAPVSAERAADGPLRLVQFGYIAPNRRLDQVLEALAELGDVNFRLEVFGTLWDRAHVEAKIAELGLGAHVALRGFAPEAELDAALARAHLVLNLRQPTMGEASGSQLRIWRNAAAAAVTDAGWYADLPSDTVFRLPQGDERPALQRLLRRIDGDRSLPAKVGQAGRARLEDLHAPDRYAEAVIEIARRFRRDTRDAMLAEAGRGVLDGVRQREIAGGGIADILDG